MSIRTDLERAGIFAIKTATKNANVIVAEFPANPDKFQPIADTHIFFGYLDDSWQNLAPNNYVIHENGEFSIISKEMLFLIQYNFSCRLLMRNINEHSEAFALLDKISDCLSDVYYNSFRFYPSFNQYINKDENGYHVYDMKFLIFQINKII